MAFLSHFFSNLTFIQNKTRFHHADTRGFTLVELMVVLVIVGLLTGGFFSAAAIYMKEKRREDMQVRMDDVRAALSRYILDDPDSDTDEARYPCPAPLTAAPGSLGYGEELCPTGAVTAGTDLGGVFVVNGSQAGELVLIGAIPTGTLDISNDLMQDEFGNRLTYAVTLALTADDALLQPSVAPGQVTVLDEAGNIKTANADFMIVSHGHDGAGSYTAAGVPNGNRCRTTATPGEGDSQNCLWQTAQTAVFKDQGSYGFSSGANDKFSDDTAVYTLAEDTGWWKATGGAGKNIVSKNTANIGIGPGITDPVQRLEIDGAIRVANTDNVCNAASAGAIRYNNNGEQDVVECCNGTSWNDIAYGCSTGECGPGKKGQMRLSPTTGLPEFCNGTNFVPAFGKDCSDGHYHGEVYDQQETQSEACDNGKDGNMTRSRMNEMLCNNGNPEIQSSDKWSEWDKTGCVDFPVGQGFTVECTSKAGRTQTISATGTGEAAIGNAPTGSSTWIVFKNGPYLNCWHPGVTTPPDFRFNHVCQKYGLPGEGRSLASCTVQ